MTPDIKMCIPSRKCLTPLTVAHFPATRDFPDDEWSIDNGEGPPSYASTKELRDFCEMFLKETEDLVAPGDESQ